MFRVFECIRAQHDHLTTSVAGLIWLFGSLALFLALARAQECRGRRRASWLAIGAVVGGMGVWATHFVAMLAYKGALPISYTLAPTVVSAAISVAGCGIALAMLGRFSLSRCLASGAVLTAAVGAMHFVGMSALRVQARVEYDWTMVGVSLGIGLAVFTLAFVAFARLPGYWHIAGAALASIIGVLVLHFTGMAATTLVFDPRLPAAKTDASQAWLIGATAGCAITIVLLTGVATLVDRYLTDLRGFAEATLEGIVILRENRIFEANSRFAEWMDHRPQDLLGMDPNRLLVAMDGRPIDELRSLPVEALAFSQSAERVFEVGIHEVEYRGRPSKVLALRDLTQTKAAQRQIEHLAKHDSLTGLANRTLLNERLDRAIDEAARTGLPLALLAIDLDRFKAVNDLFGHAEGDRVLEAVAAMLNRCVGEADTVARLGGDEFVVLQLGAAQPCASQDLADRILAIFRAEMDPAHDPAAVGVSIGIATFPQDGKDGASLYHAADIALYQAKLSGRGKATCFSHEMDRKARERQQLESDMRLALSRDEFWIAYQPMVDTETSRVAGYEALLRWEHPERGVILPIGEWVLRQACKDAARWEEPLMLAVNVSAAQFQVARLEDVVLSALAESGLAPQRLELEVTETALMKERDRTISVLQALKHVGIKIVMDDFGTGYASLSNLQCFPFDKLKIDRSFIQSMETDEAARSIVYATTGIGRSLNLPIVAEGVETENQRRLAVEAGCQQAQGFLFGAPAPLAPRSIARGALAHSLAV